MAGPHSFPKILRQTHPNFPQQELAQKESLSVFPCHLSPLLQINGFHSSQSQLLLLRNPVKDMSPHVTSTRICLGIHRASLNRDHIPC